MFSKILWLLCNILIISLSTIFDKQVMIFIFLSILSIPFLYNNFLDSIKDFKAKRISLKTLFKEYKKYLTVTGTTLFIILKTIFGISFISSSLLEFHFVISYETLGDSLILFIGVLILVSLVKDVVKFNN